MHTDNRMDTRHRHDVSFNPEFDVIRARRLRAQVLAGFFRAVRHRVLIALRKLTARMLRNQPGVASAKPRRLSSASGVGRRPRNAL